MLHPHSGFFLDPPVDPPMTPPGVDAHCCNALAEFPLQEEMVARPFMSLTRPSLVMITRVGMPRTANNRLSSSERGEGRLRKGEGEEEMRGDE